MQQGARSLRRTTSVPTHTPCAQPSPRAVAQPFRSVSRSTNPTSSDAAIANPPIDMKATVKPPAPAISATESVNMPGLVADPASAMRRFTPKNLPRAPAGATSEPRVCIEPAMNDTARLMRMKPSMKNGSPSSPQATPPIV